MQKLFILFILTIAFHLANAQQKYFPFSINDKHGITDTLGNEAIKPIYKYSQFIEAKNQIYLQDYSSKSDLIFDAKTGAKQLFEAVYNNQVKIMGVPYTRITNKGKRYLLSEESSKTINLTEEYTDFKNVGDYIVAKYYPKRIPSKSTQVDKNGIPLPPKIEPMPEETSTILANDENLKRLIKGSFDSYTLMYKEKEAKEDDGLVHVELIKIEDYNKPTPNFDFILLTKGNSHNLYNGKMILIKTFVLAKATEEMLLAASKKIIGQNLVSSYQDNNFPPPMVMAAPVGAGPKATVQKIKEKEPFKPFFYTQELANGNTLFALQETEEISNHILEVKSGAKLYLDKKNHSLTISVEGKESSEFSFNPATGVIYLPKVYFKQLGITII